jgi:hypothetical protein
VRRVRLSKLQTTLPILALILSVPAMGLADQLSPSQQRAYSVLEMELAHCYAYYAVEDGCARKLHDQAHRFDFGEKAKLALSALLGAGHAINDTDADMLKIINGGIESMAEAAGNQCLYVNDLHGQEEAACQKLVAAPDARIEELTIFDHLPQ